MEETKEIGYTGDDPNVITGDQFYINWCNILKNEYDDYKIQYEYFENKKWWKNEKEIKQQKKDLKNINNLGFKTML